jgi:hypothetical protein
MESITCCSSKRYRRQKLKIWWSRNAEPQANGRCAHETAHTNTQTHTQTTKLKQRGRLE